MSKLGNELKMAIILQSRGRMKVSELAEELEVSERQIKNYRKDLEQAGIFINSKSGAYGGYEILNNGNLLGLNIKETDIAVLDMVNEHIKFNNDIYKDEFREIVDKIKATVNMKNDNKANMSYFLVQSKGNYNQDRDKEKCIDINIACITRKKIKIKYTSLKLETSERVIHPYGLFSYKGDKYIVAYCEKKSDMRDFKLCRIKEYEILDERFEIDSKFSWDKYRENCIGIWKDEDMQIKLEIKYPLAETIKEKIWVDNQIIEEYDNKSIIFQATMKGYPEIKSWILSMGSSVKIIEPLSLKEDILREINSMIKANT